MMDYIIRMFYLLVAVEIIMGIFWNFNRSLPKIPGDINYDRPGFRFYIPFTSAFVVTILIAIVMNTLHL